MQISQDLIQIAFLLSNNFQVRKRQGRSNFVFMFRICTTFESGLCIRSKIKLDQIKVKRLHNSTIAIVKSEKDNQSIHAFSKSFFFLKEHGFAISYYEN